VSRPALARIDLAAFRHNYRLAKKLHGGRALAVIKANAYGHGALQCARALAAEADGYAVACLEEALQLRAGGLRQPILVLEGIFAGREMLEVAEQDIWIAVRHTEQIRMIETDAPAHARIHAWLKVDSGMHRAGFAPAEAVLAYQRLLATGKVSRITLMSHFARADEPDCSETGEQTARFDTAVAGLPGDRSLCNSAAILAWPGSRRDWARPGIMLYGVDPTPGCGHELKPVMTLQSEVMGVKTLRPGDDLGYGARFTASRPTAVGLVAMGYADGYPRIVPDGTPVAVDGRPSRIIGRVSMDMLTVDLTDLPGSGLGSRVELWGPQVPVADVAAAAGTIAYELLCNVKRVRTEYCDEEPHPAARRMAVAA
jgi:alanine racemase